MRCGSGRVSDGGTEFVKRQDCVWYRHMLGGIAELYLVERAHVRVDVGFHSQDRDLFLCCERAVLPHRISVCDFP